MKTFKDLKELEENHIYFVGNRNGLGDFIASLTVISYINEFYPWVKAKLVAPDYIKDYCKLIFPNIKVYNFEDIKKLSEKHKASIAILRDLDSINTIRMPIIDQAFVTWTNHMPDPKWPKNYVKTPLCDVSKFNLPERYVCIPVMHTSPTREFKSEIIDRIVNYLKSNDITPVFLGKKEAPAFANAKIMGFTKFQPEGKGINLIDKTTLQEGASVMAGALAVVGLDNGLLHLAATTDVPIIYGFTTVDPCHRLPTRNNVAGWKIKSVTPPEELKCRYCQSQYNFVYKHDFKFCYEDDYACIVDDNGDGYINALDEVLNDRW